MLDFVVKLKVLVCRPAAPRRTSARPAHKHAQSRRFADGPRCRGGHQVRTSGAASPRDWPGEARPRSRPGRRGVEPAPTCGAAHPRARTAARAALACRRLHQWRPRLLWRPVMPLKCFFGDQWGVCGAAAASHALRNLAGWRQATFAGQIRSLCGVQAA